MEEDDIDYGALFGVTPDEGGQEPAQEPGEQGAEPPVSDLGAQDQEGQEVAAGEDRHSAGAVIRPSGEQPAQQSSAAYDRSGGRQAAQGQEPQVQEPEQKPDQGQADAQARAQYEAAAAKARADAQRAIDEAFARSGLRNPYTGQPITTKAEYDAYREKFDAERRAQVLKQTGMSEEEFVQFIQGLPEVRKAQDAREAAEKAQREAQEAAARVKIDEQLREIGAMDPSVKSLEDLAKMPTYQRFYELVQRGNTLTDAFRLANFDALAQRAAAGARQAAVNAVRGKEHLEQTRTRGKGAVSVPPEVREQYKFFNPDATEEEIQTHYQRSHKEG